MSKINQIYQIDESFKQEKQSLISKHDKQLAKLSNDFLDLKADLLKKSKKSNSQSKSVKATESEEDITKELSKKFEKIASSNKTKLKKYIESCLQ